MNQIGILIFFFVAIYPFMVVYERFGIAATIGLGVLVLAGFAVAIYYIRRRDRKSYEATVRWFLTCEIPPDEARAVYRGLETSVPGRMEFLRNVQLISDSIRIAISSKKRDTAESRMQMAKETFDKMALSPEKPVSNDVFEEIRHRVMAAKIVFPSMLHVNIARGHVEHARKLKTKKARAKYLDLAEATIMDGIELTNGMDHRLDRELVSVREARNALLGDDQNH